MAAPTLETNAAADTLRILDGTSGDGVTWNDVWDWDDGGGSSGGDGDVPKDGGGTAKVNTFMTEIVADEVYLILKTINFGDGSTPSYFVSLDGEMVHFADTMGFTIKTDATLRWGDVVAGYGYRGSTWSIKPSAHYRIIDYNQSCSFLMYDSKLIVRGVPYVLYFLDGTIKIHQSSLTWGTQVSPATPWFNTGVDVLELVDVYFSYFYNLTLLITPDVFSGVHIHHAGYGIGDGATGTTIADGANITDAATVDYQTANFAADIVLVARDPISPVSKPRIDLATGIIKEQYTCNIHMADKDGADLASALIDCEYAHLVEGSDSKTYKCIADHTAVDADHKPITGTDWADYWVLYDAGGGLGGDWTTGFDYKSGTAEFSQQTTDANGDMTEQNIQYKKWTTTSELLEGRVHKFTVSKAGYETLVLENVNTSQVINWWHLELSPQRARIYGRSHRTDVKQFI